jgi:hypothetical protein
MFVAALILNTMFAAAQQGSQEPPPVPRPFPGAPSRPAPTRPGVPAPPPAPPPPSTAPSADDAPPPTPATLGLPLYPGAQFIRSYYAGRGQRYYLFGSAALFGDVVAFYRTALRQRGTLVFEVPATHQFDVGKFEENTMVFPPGVTVKDYQSATSKGFPNPEPGGLPEQFPTIIQIVR